jgi:hypothetical protein
MTDREKLLGLLDNYRMDSIEAILNCFLGVYGDDIDIRRMHELMKTVDQHLEYKIDQLGKARFVANERAGYIKKYLEGKMWPNEELARQYLQPQIDNAQAIIDACNC